MFKKQIQADILDQMSEMELSASDVARRMCVSRQCIHIWLKTSDVSLDKLSELADLVGLEIVVETRKK